tara:strand:- start:1175 stop:1420 length:246 start_codon:yes stop_codon:yes gene_type:complete
MKKITYILIAIVLMACESNTVDTSKPAGIPDYVTWGTYEHQAYKDGRIYWSKDSSIMIIVPERPQYNETSTSLLDSNVIIN